jgi:hypothetical protein
MMQHELNTYDDDSADDDVVEVDDADDDVIITGELNKSLSLNSSTSSSSSSSSSTSVIIDIDPILLESRFSHLENPVYASVRAKFTQYAKEKDERRVRLVYFGISKCLEKMNVESVANLIKNGFFDELVRSDLEGEKASAK